MLELILLPVLLSGAAILAHVCQKPHERLSILAASAHEGSQPGIPPDLAFVTGAMKGGVYGLLLGTLAIERSHNPEIMAFAAKMIRQNQLINIELASISRRKGISTAETLDADQRGLIQQLAQLSGADFDNRFLIAALTEYQDTIKTFQQEKQAGKDKELQTFASGTIPRLQKQLKLGENAEGSLGVQHPTPSQ
jgi:putative membrane protein